MHDKIIHIPEFLVDMFFNTWLWFTVGLISVVAFFGRRLVKEWDRVVKSHMPEKEIKVKFDSILRDMKTCEKKIVLDQSKLIADMKVEINIERKELQESVDKVHERIDDLMTLLIQQKGN